MKSINQLIIYICINLIQVLAKKIRIDIYFESQCEGCQNFISNSLRRALDVPQILQILEINLYPYGNAYQFQNSDGSWTFRCQHGIIECYGNLLEVCSMNLIKDPLKKLQYVFCIETSNLTQSINQFQEANNICAPQFGIQARDAERCIDSRLGNILQHGVGLKTETLSPRNTKVPWIVIDDKYERQEELHIIDNLIEWTCNHSKQAQSYDFCSDYISYDNNILVNQSLQNKKRA